MLHVHPRTVRYWISGKTLIPYSAYRLLRILTGSELPSNGWDGWHMHSTKLWSPEGHGFLPSDSSWWGLLVRQARGFKTLYDRETLLGQQAMHSGDVAAAVGGACAAGSLAVVATEPEKVGNGAVSSGGPVTRHFSRRQSGLKALPRPWNGGVLPRHKNWRGLPLGHIRPVRPGRSDQLTAHVFCV